MRRFSSNPFPSPRRVVITGLGVISPLGISVPLVWQRLIDGKSGIRTLESVPGFSPAFLNDFPVKVCAPVRKISIGTDEILSEEEKSDLFNPKLAIARPFMSTCSPFIEYAVAASGVALKDSRWLPNSPDFSFPSSGDPLDGPAYRTGVCLGSGIGSLEDSTEAALGFQAKGKKGVSPYTIPRLLVNLAAGQVSMHFGLKGPNHAVATACTTGAHSIGDAFRFIQSNDADVMVAGGSESSVNPLALALFHRCRALSTKFPNTSASRPFDKDRDGFVMGEGCGVVVLEEFEHAKKRGANIYAEIVGYGLSGDAHHVTSPREDGEGALLAMRAALRNSGLKPEDVDYLNAHATSTPVGDRVENLAIKRLFGAYAKKLAISSTKGSIGHALGAAGSLEAIFCILALQHGIVPPTLNLHNPDPSDGFDLDYTPLEARRKPDMRVAMTNSFGFGGTNATLIFKKYEGK